MSNTNMSTLSQEERDEVKSLVAKNNNIAAYIRNSKSISETVKAKLQLEIEANRITINTITKVYKIPKPIPSLFDEFSSSFSAPIKKVEVVKKERIVLEEPDYEEIVPEVIERREEITPDSFKNPDTEIYESADEYLSGFVRKKLIKAEFASQEDRSYLVNVDALKKVIPQDIPSELISYTLGSAWIPDGIYETFATKLFGTKITVKYYSQISRFSVTSNYTNALITNTYGAGGRDGIYILNATLNNKQIDIIESTEIEGKKKNVKNVERTAAAQGMQQLLQDKFEEFMRENEECYLFAEKIYNQIFNGYVHRKFKVYDGKSFEGASEVMFPRHHQKYGVARGLEESTLFAHEVGSGKSLLIMTTAMEMRRNGIASKPMIVLENSTMGQFHQAFKELYPKAKILFPAKKDYEPTRREKLYQIMADGDWDAILIPHSQLSIMPNDFGRQKQYIHDQIAEFEEALNGTEKRDFQSRNLNSEINKLRDELHKLYQEYKNPPKYTFEKIGFDAILIDEFDKFKRLGFRTNMKNIKGIDTSKSRRSQSVLLKMRWVQEKNKGRNTLTYTGTPISNTMAEAWTMMKFVRPDILDHLGINNFDQFAKTFGQIVPSLEQTGGGTYKIQSRFAKFQNLPEFINMFHACTDVVLSEDVQEFKDEDLLPKLKGGTISQHIIKQSPELKEQIKEFREILEAFDEMKGLEKRQNCHIPLVIYNKAKQAAIDLRLLDPSNYDSPESKLNQAIKNAFDIYQETTDVQGVQMMFCDLYQSPEPKEVFLDEDMTMLNPAFNKERFNLFEDIKKKLIGMGVPEYEIVNLNDPYYESVDRKHEVFKKAVLGIVRFLLGTTSKMGVGVNVQNKLVGLHHLDTPQRPREFTQRNGRGLRPGNTNKEIWICAYGVEKTLDSSAFQRLSVKQKFINQIMKGENLDRIMDDAADEVQVTFDEMMALLSDSPYAMQKLMVDNSIRTEKMKKDNFNARKRKNISDLKSAKEDLSTLEKELARNKTFCDIIEEKIPDINIVKLVASGVQHESKFSEAANEYIDMLHGKFKVSATNHAIGSIEINDIKIEVEFKGREEITRINKTVLVHAELFYKIPELGLIQGWYGNGFQVDSGTGVGMLSSIRRRISAILDEPNQIIKSIKDLNGNIPILEKESVGEFDETKLNELERESEMLARKMMAGNAVMEEA